MSKFTFICEDEPCPFGDSIVSKKTVEFNADHLDGIIGEFETFLRGCGFNFDGFLEVSEYPTTHSFNDGDLNRDGELDLEAREPYNNLDLHTENLFKDKRSVIRSDEC